MGDTMERARAQWDAITYRAAMWQYVEECRKVHAEMVEMMGRMRK